MSRTAAELALKLTSTGRTITSARTLALNAMGSHAKTTILASARQIVPDLNISGVGRNGTRIGVRYTVGTGAAEIKATGPWQFIEYDTKPHVITSRGLRGTRKSRQAAVQAGRKLNIRQGASPTRLNIGGSYRFYVQHPGTKGQHPWRDGVRSAEPQLPAVAAKVYRQQIARVFR